MRAPQRVVLACIGVARAAVSAKWMRVRGMAWLLAAVGGFGCATQGVPLEEISELPIAFVYWDESAARHRQEILDEMESGSQGPKREGVARMNDVARLLGATGGAGTAQLGRFPGRIALLNPRTLEVTRFAAAPPNARPLAWSADHSKLLFASQHANDGVTQLYEFDREKQELRKLTRGPDYHLEGDYAPDGQLVMTFIGLGERGPVTGVLVADSGGGNPREIFRGEYAMGVRWSPKADIVAYVETDQRSEMTRSQRDLSQVVVRPLVPDAKRHVLARGRDSVFTPDGEWIVFSSQTKKGWKLRRMRPDGSARSHIGLTVREEHTPAISPDGRHVVYASSLVEGTLDRLFIRRMDGTGDRILLEKGAAAYPVW